MNLPVGAVEERGEAVAAQPVELVSRHFEHRKRGDREEHEQQRGEQPARPTGPESGEADAAASRPLADAAAM